MVIWAAFKPELTRLVGRQCFWNKYRNPGGRSRATGLGGAFVALADDATAPYWNPAGLGQMELYLYELGLQYALLPDSTYSTYASYAVQFPELGTFSLAWDNFTAGDFTARDDQGQNTGIFSSTENVFYLSYGRKAFEWVKGLYLGTNLKILQQTAPDSSAVGHGVDIGLIWQPVLYWDHTLGLNVQNIFERLYWQGQSQSINTAPVNFKIGTALKFLRSDEGLYYDRLISTIDLEY